MTRSYIMLDELFSACAACQGDAVAVEDQIGKYSYKSMEDLSNIYAAGLAAQGIARGARVALALPPEAPLLAAMLGVLKTGAAFVHLDVTLPVAILTDLVRRSNATLVITVAGLVPADGPPVLKLDELGRVGTALPCDPSRTPDDTAFVSFTTGTTGPRKGVAVSHRSALYAYRHFWVEADHIGNSSRFALLSYFDWDALGPLVHGRTCLLPPAEASDCPEKIARFIFDANVNHCFLTPSLIDSMLAVLSKVELRILLSRLRVVWVGGEVLMVETLRRFCTLVPGVTVINNYGPSECFVVSQGRVDFAALPSSGICPVGWVLKRTRAIILDNEGRTCPLGVAGTLCVCGPCLVEGYLDDEGDAEAFFYMDGVRWFRTGDAAQFGTDGQLWVLGRVADLTRNLDGNPKRFIAARLRRYADVSACVHLRQARPNGDLHLAFVVMRPYLASKRAPELRSQSTETLRELCGLQAGEEIQIYIVPRIPLAPASRKADLRRLLGMRAKAERLF